MSLRVAVYDGLCEALTCEIGLPNPVAQKANRPDGFARQLR